MDDDLDFDFEKSLQQNAPAAAPGPGLRPGSGAQAPSGPVSLLSSSASLSGITRSFKACLVAAYMSSSTIKDLSFLTALRGFCCAGAPQSAAGCATRPSSNWAELWWLPKKLQTGELLRHAIHLSGMLDFIHNVLMAAGHRTAWLQRYLRTSQIIHTGFGNQGLVQKAGALLSV